MRDALAWYVVVQAAGLAVWPLIGRALNALDDRGWAASKTAGLLGLGWLAWLICMVSPIPFTRPTLLIALLVLAAVTWGSALRLGEVPTLLAFVRARRTLLLTFEALQLTAFVLFALLRAHAPAIAGTEKPMDMAFLNGFMAAERLPTQDTWLAGFGVPYYHFGYLILACVGKLSGSPPAIAYNLAAATIPALALLGLSALAWNVGRAASVQPPWAAAGALLASVLGLLCGHLGTFFEMAYARGWVPLTIGGLLGVNHFGEGVTPGVWPPNNSFWWFHASRVIPNLQPDGIDEFPFFSALLSDLHPHFMALPFELLVLMLGVTNVLTRGASLRSRTTLFVAAISLGGLLVINTWDIAPFWTLYVGLSALGAWYSTWRWRWAAAALTPLGGAALYGPYFVGYGGPPLGPGIVGAERTPLGSLLVLFGWAVILLAAFGLFTRWCIGDRRGWLVSGGGAVLGLALALAGQPGLAVLVALLSLLLPWPSVLQRFEPAASVGVVLSGFAAAMLLGVELIYLDDVFHSRMNTVFKFHENAWLLSAVGAGIGLAMIGRYTRRVRWIAAACAALFVAAGLVYSISAIATRLDERPPVGPTLDGVAFLSPDERAAVRWLADQNGPAGRVVIAEAVGNEYSSGARMATYSGGADVLGWAGHELQWRGSLPELGRRESDMAALYRDGPPEQIRPILDRYSVRFVVVGDVEREKYGADVDNRFAGLLTLAFRTGGTVIYRAR